MEIKITMTELILINDMIENKTKNQVVKKSITAEDTSKTHIRCSQCGSKEDVKYSLFDFNLYCEKHMPLIDRDVDQKPNNPPAFAHQDALTFFKEKAIYTIWMAVRDEISEQTAYEWLDYALDTAKEIDSRNKK